MPRPIRYRKIEYPPLLKGFMPIGTPIEVDEIITLLLEEYEALRLLDYEYLNQVEAAKRMEVSRPTLTRIYDSARKKLARALVKSLPIEIAGGNVAFADEWLSCGECHTIFQVDQIDKEHSCPHCDSDDIVHLNDSLRNQPKQKHNYHQRQNHKDKSGFCVCKKCGKRISHKSGIPCRKTPCPDCKIAMKRE